MVDDRRGKAAVTTPSAKLIRKSSPKNVINRRCFSRPVRIHAVGSPATRADRLIVRGTKKKWQTW